MGSQRNIELLVAVRYETNGHYLGSLPDLIGHTGMQYHACTSFVSAQGEQVDFQELSKFTFLSNRACWPLEVIAILQTISQLLNCIYRQLISGQMEENYQGNYKPHEIINLIFNPFSKSSQVTQETSRLQSGSLERASRRHWWSRWHHEHRAIH